MLSITISFYSAMLSPVFASHQPNSRGGTTTHRLVPYYLLAGGWQLFSLECDLIAQRIALFDPLTLYDRCAAIAIILLTIEKCAGRSASGLTVIVILFIAYNLFGHVIPGAFGHGHIELSHFLDVSIFTTDGLFGVPLRVAGTYALLFVLFGSALERCRGSEFFFDLASALTGKSAGGQRNCSDLVWSAWDNFRQPHIRCGHHRGYHHSDHETPRLSAKLAGAVEVAASTGGSLLPPVMGSGLHHGRVYRHSLP